MLFDIKNTKAYTLRPNINSNDIAWINWHRALKNDIGKAAAGVIFIKVWEKQGTSKANTVALRAYLEPEGIAIDSTVFDDIADIGSGIGNAFSRVLKFGEITGYVTVGIVVLGLGIAVYNIARNSDKIVMRK